jgi:hypothetical protein
MRSIILALMLSILGLYNHSAYAGNKLVCLSDRPNDHICQLAVYSGPLDKWVGKHHSDKEAADEVCRPNNAVSFRRLTEEGKNDRLLSVVCPGPKELQTLMVCIGDNQGGCRNGLAGWELRNFRYYGCGDTRKNRICRTYCGTDEGQQCSQERSRHPSHGGGACGWTLVVVRCFAKVP